MGNMPHPNRSATVQLPRHNAPRTVTVRTVYCDKGTAMVEYPNTGRPPLIGNLTEEVDWEHIEQ